MPRTSILYISHILAWADEHRRRTGKFPKYTSGAVRAKPDEEWHLIDRALRYGGRGLRAGSSLPRLLAEMRGYRNSHGLPKYSYRQILEWADAHKRRTGKWPIGDSGPIRGAPGETWKAVAMALMKGTRGLPGKMTLPQLLAMNRGARNRLATPLLSLGLILNWADKHRMQTGKWPTLNSGPIAASRGETWKGVEMALRRGSRGLPGGSSLGKLLAERRGKRYRPTLPKLSIADILQWADDHHARTRRWPNAKSGPVIDSPGETWRGITLALFEGGRGLRVGTTLPQLLKKHRGARRQRRPGLTIEQILEWADEHQRRTGRWPSIKSGRIPQSDGDTWMGVNAALYHGYRGLPAGLSLFKLRAKYRASGKAPGGSAPRENGKPRRSSNRR